jgi:peptidoglycan biosynthesis protein MviN/MurJ (putative lipid II flippase)
MLSPRVISTLRWIAAIVAIASMLGAGFLMYLTLFILERFGLMAILLAIALWLAATVLWWFVAEAHLPRTRARIGHIFVGALGLTLVALAFGAATRGHRVVDGLLMTGTFEAPLAFILGGTLGAFYSLLRLRGTRAV